MRTRTLLLSVFAFATIACSSDETFPPEDATTTDFCKEVQRLSDENLERKGLGYREAVDALRLRVIPLAFAADQSEVGDALVAVMPDLNELADAYDEGGLAAVDKLGPELLERYETRMDELDAMLNQTCELDNAVPVRPTGTDDGHDHGDGHHHDHDQATPTTALLPG